MRIGSLFSGIGGLELGLEWAGLGRTVWQVEREPYCQAVLARHWPDAKRFDDVRSVGSHNLQPVDIICGGFPCQDISYAGKGAGLAGKRSGLWFEFARIVREMEPKYVVVENVAALLARGMGDVLGTLASLGYDCWWDCISAGSVGAPHVRDRAFIVGYAPSRKQVADPNQIGRLETGCTRESSCSGKDGAPSSETNRRGVAVYPDRACHSEARRHWDAEPDLDRVVDGVPGGVDRVAALGNAVVPQCAEVVGWVIRELEGW